jgi:hypothetical protein
MKASLQEWESKTDEEREEILAHTITETGIPLP